jgi:CHASE1-domain containing sensor protein
MKLIQIIILVFVVLGLVGTVLRLRSQRQQSALRQKMELERSDLQRRVDELREQVPGTKKPE